MKPVVDYSVYLVTDRDCLCGRELLSCVEAALRGGVTLVQLREKGACGREFFAEAEKLLALCRRYGVPLIINDRSDIALAVGADGVHLGQDDLPLPRARRLLGENSIIGISVHSVEEARAAETGGADYIGVGAVFLTGTKKDAKALGLARLRAIRAACRLPIVGIGGINAGNYADVREAGAQGAAIVSGILSADDIEGEVRKIKGSTTL